MPNLPDGAFRGDTSSNPYYGELERGIAYDLQEAHFKLVAEGADGRPHATTNYRAGAMRMLRHFPASSGEQVLDVGSGTGIATLELLSQYPNIIVTGIEQSDGMRHISEYKFHQRELGDAINGVTDAELLQYWHDFRLESKQHSDRVKFVAGDIETADKIEDLHADNVIAVQVLHWTDLSKSFGQLHKLLNRDGYVLWSTASHFYDDADFPVRKYGFRYNPFFHKVTEEVAKHIKIDEGKWAPKPAHNIESIKAVTDQAGFETDQVDTYVYPIGLERLVAYYVKPLIKSVAATPVSDADAERIAAEAIAEAIVNPTALRESLNNYEIAPIFISRKR